MKKLTYTHYSGIALLLVLPNLAFAHPEHGLSSAYMGFMHPFWGVDHLLVMLTVGYLTAKLGGKMRWQLPLSFMGMMFFGALLGMFGLRVAGIESAIAATVMAMGVLLFLQLPVGKHLHVGLIALFAVIHGLAHGAELQVSHHLSALFGMLFATGLLHATGWLGGTALLNKAQWLKPVVAWGTLLTGTYLLVIS